MKAYTMDNVLSLVPEDDLDKSMRLVARNLAMGIYELPKILEDCRVQYRDFNRWKEHPRFLAYLKSETEAWNSAHNTAERVKVKAGIAVEEWIVDAYAELKDRKQPLNHRVALGQLVAKLAGMDSSGGAFAVAGGGQGGFSLHINISPGHVTTINAVKNDVEEATVVDEAPVRGAITAIDEEPLIDLDGI